jgi:hypothetical protein
MNISVDTARQNVYQVAQLSLQDAVRHATPHLRAITRDYIALRHTSRHTLFLDKSTSPQGILQISL